MNKFIKTLNIYNEVTLPKNSDSNCKFVTTCVNPLEQYCTTLSCTNCMFSIKRYSSKKYTHRIRKAFNDTP